jgi:hypothetical protein
MSRMKTKYCTSNLLRPLESANLNPVQCRNPVILIVIHHCQYPLDSTLGVNQKVLKVRGM